MRVKKARPYSDKGEDGRPPYIKTDLQPCQPCRHAITLGAWLQKAGTREVWEVGQVHESGKPGPPSSLVTVPMPHADPHFGWETIVLRLIEEFC